MKKINFMIVAVGFLATVGTLSSCKKEQVKEIGPSAITKSQSNARVLNADEATTLITNNNTFVRYVESYLTNSGTQVPTSIPSQFNDEQAVAYLENGFNFSYGRQDLDLIRNIKDVYTINIPKNLSSKVTIESLASTYLTVYNHIKSVYDGIASPIKDKILNSVDVRVSASNSSTITLVFTSVFGFDRVPILSPAASVITFATADEWRIDEGYLPGGYGKKGDSTDHYGSLYYIKQATLSKWTGPLMPVYPAPKFPRYLATRIYDVNFRGPGPLKVLSSATWASVSPATNESFYYAPSNPWVGRLPCVDDHDALMFGEKDYLPCTGKWMPGDAMNYSSDGLVAAFRSREARVGKSLWLFSLQLDAPSATKRLSYWVHIEQYADIIDKLLVSTAPYQSSSTGLALYPM